MVSEDIKKVVRDLNCEVLEGEVNGFERIYQRGGNGMLSATVIRLLEPYLIGVV